MSEELFERYLKNDLDEAGARRLSEILATEEGVRSFSEFVQEWTLLGEAARQRVAEIDRQGSRRTRKRASAARPGRSWIAWAAGLAAVVLFMIAIATPTRRPAPEPVAKVEPPPPAPIEPPKVSHPQPERTPPPRPDPVPVPPPAPPPPTPRVIDPPSPVPDPPKPVEPPKPEKPRSTEPEKSTRPVIAILRRAAGEVHVLSAAGRRRAIPNESLAPDEGLDVVGPHGQASIEFADSARIDVSPDSIVAGLVEKQGKRSFTLTRGSISAVVPKQPPGRSFAVSTAQADVTVVGTQFLLVATADSTRLDVREGRVRMTRADGAAVEVTANHTAIAAKGQKLESKPTLFTLELQDGLPGAVGTQDTMISGAEPARTFGSSDVLQADGDETDGKKLYALLRWDLSSVPAGAVIRSAVITLDVVNESSKASGYSLYEIRRPWSEAEATWTHATAQQRWQAAGLKPGADRGTESLGTVAPRAKGALSILLMPSAEGVIQGWLRRPELNYGFVIANDTNSDGFRFHSRDASPFQLRPRLTLTYTLAK